MQINFYSEICKFLFEKFGGILSRKLSEDNARNVKPEFLKSVDKTENIGVIGNSEVASYLVFLDITGVYRDYDFG